MEDNSGQWECRAWRHFAQHAYLKTTCGAKVGSNAASPRMMTSAANATAVLPLGFVSISRFPFGSNSANVFRRIQQSGRTGTLAAISRRSAKLKRNTLHWLELGRKFTALSQNAPTPRPLGQFAHGQGGSLCPNRRAAGREISPSFRGQDISWPQVWKQPCAVLRVPCWAGRGGK